MHCEMKVKYKNKIEKQKWNEEITENEKKHVIYIYNDFWL